MTMHTPVADLASLRSEFTIAETWSYLDHAAIGAWPRRTVAAVNAFANGFASPPGFFGEATEQAPQRAAVGIAALANADPANVAWVPSLADGMNLLLHGIDWRDGDNVVIPQNEFPSVVYPALNLAYKGVETRQVPRNADGRTDIALIAAALNERTRALCISHVEYMDGYRNDLHALGILCQERGIELFVDATQSLGAQPIDLHDTGVTALVAHGYKWLLSGFGIGVVIFNRGAVDRIRVTYAGRLSVDLSWEDHDYRLSWREGAGRYQTGGLNQAGIAALNASLELIHAAGPARTREHTLQLLDRLVVGATAQGYSVASDLTPLHRSQILTISTGDHAADGALVEHLSTHQVAVTLRGRGVRISPYFYNNNDDIDRLLEVLPPC